MGHLKFSLNEAITRISEPIRVILIREIFTVEGTPALLAKKAPFQKDFQEECRVLQVPLLKKVSEGGRINPLNLRF